MIRFATGADAEAMAAIYRPIVAATAISIEAVPPGPAEMARRIAATLEVAPWLVYEEHGRVAGYAYGSRHRDRAAYQGRWT
jgi:phosphinothricin acetyltransferase